VTALTGTLALVLCLADAGERPASPWIRRVGLAIPLLTFALYAALNVRITLAGSPLHLEQDRLQPYGSYGEYRVVGQRDGARDYAKGGAFVEECRRISATCREEEARGSGRAWTMEVRRPAKVRLPVLSFPAWEVRLDGAPVERLVEESTGLIAVELPPGEHTVAVNWMRLPQEIVGVWLSVISLTILILLSARRAFARRATIGER
jgi:hypothetical protein